MLIFHFVILDFTFVRIDFLFPKIKYHFLHILDVKVDNTYAELFPHVVVYENIFCILLVALIWLNFVLELQIFIVCMKKIWQKF
jgi:hypothetical protein